MPLRIGKITDINEAERTVRVYFEEVGIKSDWLKVLKNTPSTYYNDSPRDTPRTDTEQLHYHNINFIPWFPKIGDFVLCAYNSGFNEDGFVLGGLP